MSDQCPVCGLPIHASQRDTRDAKIAKLKQTLSDVLESGNNLALFVPDGEDREDWFKAEDRARAILTARGIVTPDARDTEIAKLKATINDLILCGDFLADDGTEDDREAWIKVSNRACATHFASSGKVVDGKEKL